MTHNTIRTVARAVRKSVPRASKAQARWAAAHAHALIVDDSSYGLIRPERHPGEDYYSKVRAAADKAGFNIVKKLHGW